MAETFATEDRGAVRILWLDRPAKLNALDTALTRALHDGLLAADADRGVRALVLAGRGRAFCAGADLAEFKELTPQNQRLVLERADLTTRTQLLLQRIGKPIVSAVQGAAMGGGAGLAIGCDMMVAGEDLRFGYPEMRHSIVPAIVMTGLVRQAGRKAAFELVSLGRILGAEAVRGLGLANRVVAADAVVDTALEIAGAWAEANPLAMAATKGLFHRVADLTTEAAMAAGRDVNALMRGFREDGVTPLAGITVLDFSRVLAGPMATQVLGELGARVIKVERPGVGDESRQWEPALPGGDSAYFFAFNRGKRSVALNLKHAEGRAVARALAAKADVVVENFLPGEMERMGLGYAALAEVNPGLVYVSNTGFGQDGPYRDRRGYDTIFQALSGVMALTGHPDGPPAKVGLPFADLTSGLWIAVAALAGLAGRGASGRGMHVDVAMLDAQVALLTIAAARLFALNEEPGRTGTEHPGRVPSAAFRCRDGLWLHISGSDQHWPAICAALGLENDPGLARNAARVARRAEVMAAMTAAIGLQDRAALAEALRAAQVPAGEVNSVGEILADPHVAARGMVGAFEHPTAGRFPALRLPLREVGGVPAEVEAPPLLGADTDAVLAEVLGMDAAGIAALRAAGAVA